MCLCKIGINPEGFVILVNGLLVLALVQENISKVIMCLRIIGINPEGFVILINRLLVLALFRENISKVIMCLRKIGINPEGFVKMSKSPLGTRPGSRKHFQGCYVPPQNSDLSAGLRYIG